MAAGMKFLQRIGKVFGDTAIGIDGAFDAVAIQRIHDAPDAGFAAILAISQRRVVGFIALVAAILR